MKTLNPNIWPYLWRFILVVGVVAAICMALPGCSPARQLIKAEQKVLTNPESFEKVGRKYVEINPCVNDSSSTFKAGGIDSAAIQEYYDWINGKFYDQDTIRQVNIDELGGGQIFISPKDDGKSFLHISTGTDFLMKIFKDSKGREKVEFGSDAAKQVYEYAYKRGVNDFIAKYPPKRPDTVKTTVKDKQYIKLLEADIAKERAENAHLKGIIETLEKDNKVLHQKITGWIWLFVAACSIGVAGIIATFFIKRKGLPI